MAEVVVVGLSARALSQSARSGGYTPLAVDLFCDLDTREASERCARIESDLARGIEWQPLEAALVAVSDGRNPVGIVYGSGFEDRPELLNRMAERWPLIGNNAAAVVVAMNPATLSALCSECGIPHPKWSESPQGPDWVGKKVGGSGGVHVDAHAVDGRLYWQERVPGEPVSVLVLASGNDVMVLGLSAQWPDPARGAPFRYGGAVRPADLAPEIAAELADAAARIVVAAGLVGLNSVDFLVGEGSWHLIEINPRPGATMDIFRPERGSLLALHFEACRGHRPSRAPVFSGAAAARIVYAERDVPYVPEYAWPDWTADRQPPGTTLKVGDPLCTVLAEAETSAEARRLVGERGRTIAAALGAG